MDFILKFIPKEMLAMAISMLLMKYGTELKNKDADEKGADDEAGNFMLALAPAILALDSKNENAKRKAYRIARDTLNRMIGE